MAVIKITELPAADVPLTYQELIPIVQSDVTRKVSLQNVFSIKNQNFTGNGTQTQFTLAAATTENATNIFINGVYQQKNTYAVSSAVVTFSEAPPINSSIEVMYA